MEENNIYKFRQITDKMNELYTQKNADYGDSFTKSLDDFGLIAGVVRLSDKFNRIKNLTKQNTQQVREENIEDTLLDLANYSVMCLIWLENQKEK